MFYPKKQDIIKVNYKKIRLTLRQKKIFKKKTFLLNCLLI